MASTLRRTGLPSLAFLLVAGLPLAAQMPCAQWQPGEGIPGTNGDVWTLATWDPDGPGSLPEVIVAGGTFTRAGYGLVGGLAFYDPANRTWSPFGSGTAPFPSVYCSTSMPNGDLVVSGYFTSIDGTAANGIARFDGSGWSPFGSGLGSGGVAAAFAVLPNGDLVVGGAFATIGGVPVGNIARWDGTSWSTFGTGLNGGVSALAVMPNGDLIAAGSFSSAGGVLTNRIARWDGSSWSALGSGIAPTIGFDSSSVSCLQVLPNGDLAVGGWFDHAGGQAAYCAARWNGTSWSAMSASHVVRTFTLAANGDLLAGGTFYSPVTGTMAVARWTGSQWDALVGLDGIATNAPRAMRLLPGGDLLVAGSLTSASGLPLRNVARWDGSTWGQPNSGLDGRVTCIAVSDTGDRYVGGAFRAAGGQLAGGIARWDGANWSTLGTGVIGANGGEVRAIEALPGGAVVVGGTFYGTPGIPSFLAYWNGTHWGILGVGPNGNVHCMLSDGVLLGNGLVVGGDFTTVNGSVPAQRLAIFDGAFWWPLGSGCNGSVRALARLADGSLVVAGYFTTANGVATNRIVRVQGTTWSPLGSGTDNGIEKILVLQNGDLIAAGQFTTAGGVAANHIARWDGTAWSPLGGGLDGPVYSLEQLPDGDLVVGGSFTHAGGIAANRIARWDGGTWSTFGAGITGLQPVCDVEALSWSGVELWAGGSFDFADTFGSVCLARRVSTCPAAVQSVGVGCPGSGGGDLLIPRTLPWVDGTFTSQGVGLPDLAIVAALTSFTAIPQGAFPLAYVFAQAPAGCDLLVLPDIVQTAISVGGIAESSFRLPNVPPIVGLSFYHQMVPFEFDLQGNIVEITATNSLQLTAGDF